MKIPEETSPALSATDLKTTIKHEMAQFKPFILAILNGTSLGIIIALIPAALTSQIIPLFGTNGLTRNLLMMVTVIQSLLPVIAALAVGHAFKFDVLDTAALGFATFVSAGILKPTKTGLTIAGTGAILNVLLVLTVTASFIFVIHKHLGQLRLILEPTLVVLICGSIGLLTLPAMVGIQTIIGQLVSTATTLTPILMGAMLGMIFALLIVSPLSSVGIATAISLTGIGSGAANAGIIVTSFALAAMGVSVNSFGGTIAHFVGSPKIQMANMLAHPVMFIPILTGSGIMGAFAAILGVGGTAFSAGFGLSGLIGPLTALQTTTGTNVGLRVLLAFIILPIILALALKVIFVNQLHLVKPDYLKLPL
ncbi:PTS sugar transporter subunit IIC [Furfurilactobacillus rossiae]|uniref:Membrane spanning protein n=1 Tax=Furfurilactobacillus rossiae DSM 15814 TaxID=1114972 RepID=A0A0R1RL52_9LACO|nr:PTS sugar transporter subunit IIC [Furfurilactobacillus rossiae]KRL56862.1 membrane spanning protein [Furfurilactobacillus rossiae DSM 15814]QFR67107.1 hypothetical protein LR814_08350 [Furfurilactobacillus rossiae]QLE62614.1 Membrane protein [Furfurilactobacillus rossiae]